MFTKAVHSLLSPSAFLSINRTTEYGLLKPKLPASELLIVMESLLVRFFYRLLDHSQHSYVEYKLSDLYIKNSKLLTFHLLPSENSQRVSSFSLFTLLFYLSILSSSFLYREHFLWLLSSVNKAKLSSFELCKFKLHFQNLMEFKSYHQDVEKSGIDSRARQLELALDPNFFPRQLIKIYPKILRQ